MRRLFITSYVCALVIGLWLLVTTFVPQAASLSSTIWPVILYNTWPAGVALSSNTTLDTTIHPVVCVDPTTYSPIPCVPTPAPTYTPTFTPTATFTPVPTATPTAGIPLSNIDASGVGTVLFNQNSIKTLTGLTYGVENTSLLNYTVPGNTLSAYDFVECDMFGDVQNNSGGAQTYNIALKFGNRSTSYNAALTSALASHGWQIHGIFENETATNLNAFYDWFILGNSTGVIGAHTTGTTFAPQYGAAGIDTTQPMTVALGVTVGVATPAATPTSTPTSATTPIFRVYGGLCKRWPGQTPTPTPTPTHTPTATPT